MKIIKNCFLRVNQKGCPGPDENQSICYSRQEKHFNIKKIIIKLVVNNHYLSAVLIKNGKVYSVSLFF